MNNLIILLTYLHYEDGTLVDMWSYLFIETDTCVLVSPLVNNGTTKQSKRDVLRDHLLFLVKSKRFME